VTGNKNVTTNVVENIPNQQCHVHYSIWIVEQLLHKVKEENMYYCRMGHGRNVNSKCDRFWSYKNSPARYEVLSRGCKVGVWCVVGALKVMEPGFLEETISDLLR